MAHTLITPTVVAREALAVLYNTTVAAQLVHRDFDSEFAGKVGDTVNVRTPTTFEVDEFDRAQGIQLQDALETSFPVVLDTILDVSFPVTSEDATLLIDDFRGRFLTPAMEAIAQDMDGRLVEKLVDIANGGGGGGVVDDSPPAGVTGDDAAHYAYAKSRAKFSRAKLSQAGRFVILSPEAVSYALSDPLLVKANESGSTAALRDADIGRIHGFNSYESNQLGYGPNDKGQADGVAGHRDALALVTRTLERPEGLAANQVAIENYGGFGLRVVKGYDINKKQDVCSVDLLIGVNGIPSRTAGAIELDFGQGS